MSNLNKTIHLFLQKLDHLDNKNIVVGFSGGADSTALLHLLKEKQPFFNYNLKSVFFSHEGSPLIENEDVLKKHCIEVCEKMSIELVIHPLYLEKQRKQSWESSGRIARMKFYKENPADYIFLGHHKDDQNETTMMQLFRGAGKGVLAMKKIEGFYCRPFLEHHKKDIYEYLNEKNLTWIEDSTNQHNEFTRNFWRNIGLPTINKYYPQYSQQLDTFRQKTHESNQLAYDLAQVDGLANLITNNSVTIKDLSDLRIKNLVTHFFNHYKLGLEKPYLENQLNNYTAKKNSIIEKNDFCLYLNKGIISSLPLENKNLKKITNKL